MDAETRRRKVSLALATIFSQADPSSARPVSPPGATAMLPTMLPAEVVEQLRAGQSPMPYATYRTASAEARARFIRAWVTTSR